MPARTGFNHHSLAHIGNSEVARDYHFITGLPRSGSTLLAAILGQNPDIHAGPVAPVAGLFIAMQDQLGGLNERAMMVSDDQRKRLLRGLFDQYYDDQPREQVVFDSHRSWSSQLRPLKALFPASKMIACVRDLLWVVDAIEQVARSHAFRPSPLFDYPAGGTVYDRADRLLAAEGMVGRAYHALKEVFYGQDGESLLILQYETLTQEPAKALAAVYDFLGLPAYDHDFDDIRFDAAEHDRLMGTPGLHSLHGPVRSVDRRSILPPDLAQRLSEDMFWHHRASNLGKVKVI